MEKKDPKLQRSKVTKSEIKTASKTKRVVSAPKVKAKEPQTMADLLAANPSDFKTFRVGQSIEGIITEKTASMVYVDIGGKTEGVVIDREYKLAKDFIRGLEVGDKIKAIVTATENDKGQAILSLKRAASESVWQEFEEKLKTGEVINVKGREVNKGGLIVEIKGLQGFIPSSQFSAQLTGKIEDLLNKNVEVKTIEVDREKNRLIFSEKEVSEASLLKAQEEALDKIPVGGELAGKITGVMPFGLFVRIDKFGLEGLVHISEISWEKVDDPSKFYKQGDKVQVKVLAVDKKMGKLNLSIKQLLEDPWGKIAEKYPIDTKIKGKVIRLAPFGVFVSLESGIEGLIHISKIPADKTFEIDEKVGCYVESVDVEHRRMSLGLVLAEKPVGYK